MHSAPCPLPDREALRKALLIRRVEESFLDLFSQGRLMGTVHTCLGQEFSALAFAGQLDEGDCVFSNHRCHGHFLALTGDTDALMAELMGRAGGVCAGIGSSQHLCRPNFYSNGIQGGMVPVAAGLALARKLEGKSGIAVAFIGDGTLGEGVVYEAMNLAAKWSLPLLIVCEHNGYAQSTPAADTLSGSPTARAEAFGLATRESATADPVALMEQATRSIRHVRETGQPLFHLVRTYRLGPHSKGDDNRDPAEIERHRDLDPLTRFEREEPQVFADMRREADAVVRSAQDKAQDCGCLELSAYLDAYASETPEHDPGAADRWTPVAPAGARMVGLLNTALETLMARDGRVVLVGEDIKSPYGGAFKVTKGLSDAHPGRVFSTPISEAGITGLCNGLALAGMRPILEIMFGDFVTLCLDQLINHAAKFRSMYNRQASCPLILRTPMGGGRAYGPTHSQSLDKFLLGVDMAQVVALNTLVPPLPVYEALLEQPHPSVVLEHKVDYARMAGPRDIPGYACEVNAQRYPVARIRPRGAAAGLTIAAYGGMAHLAADCLQDIFVEHELLAEVIIPTRLHPLDATAIRASVERTGRLLVIEEGSLFAGFGAELVARLHEELKGGFRAARVGCLPMPIPSCAELEKAVLPNRQRILKTIGEALI